MYDFEGSTASTQTLSTYLHKITVSNVYRMFFNYTQVLQVCTPDTNARANLKIVKVPTFSAIPTSVAQPTAFMEDKLPKSFHDFYLVCFRNPTEDHDYIHANWVDGYREPKKFILTQAPLAHTIYQFWNMVWQEKSVLVVSMIQMFDINGAEVVPRIYDEPRNSLTFSRIFDDIKLVHCGTQCIRRSYDATILKVRVNFRSI
ncbi:unnamed protein product [Strongylus vulgaris]|uniref:protein-tyrosine-phosphatase n=1 Tax=Strongylus vulgaris TaxID=40348 RepID=A0A3P7IBG2_STRVU|nr:unnamed protein product [Strongylus vulgaris]